MSLLFAKSRLWFSGVFLLVRYWKERYQKFKYFLKFFFQILPKVMFKFRNTQLFNLLWELGVIMLLRRKWNWWFNGKTKIGWNNTLSYSVLILSLRISSQGTILEGNVKTCPSQTNIKMQSTISIQLNCIQSETFYTYDSLICYKMQNKKLFVN